MQPRAIREAVRDHGAAPTPLPDSAPLPQVVWGAAQILLGVRMLLGHRRLWARALKPILALVAVVLVAVVLSLDEGVHQALGRGYGILIGAGAAPAFLFANTYARFAADAHELLGLGAVEPHLTSLRTRLSQLIRFGLVTVIPTLPLVLLARQLPGIGRWIGLGIGSLWALYFTVVEQLDNARVARARDAFPEPLLMPWFVGWTQNPAIPLPFRPVIARFGKLCARLARPWVEELDLTRRHPAPSLGFGGAVGLLLAIPVVNLFVRPAAIVAGVHLRARTERP